MTQLDKIFGQFETFRVNDDYISAKNVENEKYIKPLFFTNKDNIEHPKHFIYI